MKVYVQLERMHTCMPQTWSNEKNSEVQNYNIKWSTKWSVYVYLHSADEQKGFHQQNPESKQLMSNNECLDGTKGSILGNYVHIIL